MARLDCFCHVNVNYRALILACIFKIIISEKCVPMAQKTIKPVQAQTSKKRKSWGLAGGEKYIAAGIIQCICANKSTHAF